MIRFKICCIQNIGEANMAVECGASAIGLVSEMPSGIGPISENLIAEIVPYVPPGVATFLLTSKLDAESIIRQQHRTRANTLQLVDAVSTETLVALRSGLPGISLVQVIHVRGKQSVEEACNVAPYVDGLLLDSGNPTLSVKVLGGTGQVHDWKLSREIVETSGKPVFLAGGLKAENVAEAIRAVRPYGVDVCSGLRKDGLLQKEKLDRFVDVLRKLNNDSTDSK